MKANLRYWQAVLRAAQAELDAATTNSALKIAARNFMRARRQVASLTKQEASPTAKSRRRLSHDSQP
jgi:hypothetical protein